jgi:hypothetical protein
VAANDGFVRIVAQSSHTSAGHGHVRERWLCHFWLCGSWSGWSWSAWESSLCPPSWERGLCPSVRAAGPGLAGHWSALCPRVCDHYCEKARSARLPGKERSAPARRARRRPPSHPHCPETGPIQCDIPFCDRAPVPVCPGKRALPLRVLWSWSAWESKLALPARKEGSAPRSVLVLVWALPFCLCHFSVSSTSLLFRAVSLTNPKVGDQEDSHCKEVC